MSKRADTEVIRKAIVWQLDRHDRNVIYGISFYNKGDWIGTYIGKTERYVYERVNQHLSDYSTVREFINTHSIDSIYVGGWTEEEWAEEFTTLSEAELMAIQRAWEQDWPLINKIIPYHKFRRQNELSRV